MHNRHVLGCKTDKLQLLPSLPLRKTSRREYSTDEKYALIDEDSTGASNLDRLQLEGTHYEEYSPSEIQLMMGIF